MKTTKLFDLTHEEVCLALVDYIQRNSDEKIESVQTLYVNTKNGKIETCTLELNKETP